MRRRMAHGYRQALQWVQAGSDAARSPFFWPAWVALPAALGFFLLAAVVVAGGTLRADDGLELAAHADATPDLMALLRALTDLGYPPVLTAIVVAADLLFLRLRRRLAAVMLTATMLGEGALDDLTKLALHRQRPQLFPHPAAAGWSFPSGHAFATLCLAALLVGLAWCHIPRLWRPPVVALAALLVLGIGASRVFLGVHYPSDIVGGWLGAAAWLGAVSAWLRHRLPASVSSGCAADATDTAALSAATGPQRAG